MPRRVLPSCGCASRGLFPRLALSGIHQQGEEAEVLAGYVHGVELFGVRDFGKAPLHRLCRMHGTGDVLRFGLRVVEGEALLEIGIDRRTSPGGAVCTMWNIL